MKNIEWRDRSLMSTRKHNRATPGGRRELSHWIHHRPIETFPSLVSQLGIPNWIVNKPHGMVFWKPRGGLSTLFDEHILRDEDVPHCVPAKHHDYFYTSIKYYIPKARRLDVLQISGSIAYDGLKKMLTARCASLQANIATLYLGMCVASGRMTIEEVKRGELYRKHIRGEAKSHDDMRREMFHLKRENHKIYNETIRLPRDPLAEKKCPDDLPGAT
jgi:hypothetical protein